MSAKGLYSSWKVPRRVRIRKIVIRVGSLQDSKPQRYWNKVACLSAYFQIPVLEL